MAVQWNQVHADVVTAFKRFAQRASRLDRLMLGDPVPDERPLHQKILRPRPVVTTTKARFWYVVLLVAMFVDLLLGLESVLSTVVFLALFAGLFVVTAFDMRSRSRDRESEQDQH